ncbi:MAG: NUDIX domain-containing protein [Actinobacteria bacterium]|nr:NUDIX domain-containing protein [Actinomycetota bacterium]
MRLPHEVLVFLHRRLGDESEPEFLVLHRTPRYESYWHVVAGALEVGETAAEAAVREVWEETALDVRGSLRELERRYVYPLSEEAPEVRARFDPDVQAVTVECFAAEAPAEWRPRLNDEHDAFRWCSADEALALLRWPDTHEVLRALSLEWTSA